MKKILILVIAALLMMSSIALADDAPAPTIISTACTANSDCPAGQTCGDCPSPGACGSSAKICLAAAGTTPVVAPDLDFPAGATRVTLCADYSNVGTYSSGTGPTAPLAPHKTTLNLRNRDPYDVELTWTSVSQDRFTLQFTKKAGATPESVPMSITLTPESTEAREIGYRLVSPEQEIKVRRVGSVWKSEYIEDHPVIVYLMRGACVEFDAGPRSEATASTGTSAVTI